MTDARYHDIDIGTVFEVLGHMKNGGSHEAFARQCKDKGLKLRASEDLVNMAKAHLVSINAPALTSGYPCKSCPDG